MSLRPVRWRPAGLCLKRAEPAPGPGCPEPCATTLNRLSRPGYTGEVELAAAANERTTMPRRDALVIAVRTARAAVASDFARLGGHTLGADSTPGGWPDCHGESITRLDLPPAIHEI